MKLFVDVIVEHASGCFDSSACGRDVPRSVCAGYDEDQYGQKGEIAFVRVDHDMKNIIVVGDPGGEGAECCDNEPGMKIDVVVTGAGVFCFGNLALNCGPSQIARKISCHVCHSVVPMDVSG